MKKLIMVFALILALTACGKDTAEDKKSAKAAKSTGGAAAGNEEGESSSQQDSSWAAEVPEYEQGEEIKDFIRGAFGHETNAHKRQQAELEKRQAELEEKRRQQEQERAQRLEQLDQTYTLTEGPNLSVERTKGPYEEDNIQWVITYNGRTVLERGADNEFTYRYFYGGDQGKYTYHLQAFVEGEYRTVSNTIEIDVTSDPEKGDDSAIITLKGNMKHTLKTMRVSMTDEEHEEGAPHEFTYRMGYIGDFDDDELPDGIVYMLADDGTALVRLMTGGEYNNAEFSNYDMGESYYAVWFDPVGQRDRLCFVNLNEGMRVYDALTGDELFANVGGEYTIASKPATAQEVEGLKFEENTFYPTVDEGADEDHFIVSRDHTGVLEGAF